MIHIAFEQYLFFKLKPEFNDVYVAGSGGDLTYTADILIKKMKIRGIPLYVYNKDNSCLIHAFYSYRQAARLLPCNSNAIQLSIYTKRSIFGVNFSTKLIESAKIEYISIESLNKIMLTNKTIYGMSRPGKKPSIIFITHLITKESWQFKTIPDLNRFFKCLSLKKISTEKFMLHVSVGEDLYGFKLTKYYLKNESIFAEEM